MSPQASSIPLSRGIASRPLLALDFGTSTLRALVGLADGRVLGSAQAPVRYFTPEGLSSMAREFGPDEVASLLVHLARSALGASGVQGADVGAIAVTSQRQGVVFLDASGHELYAGPNADVRAALQGAKIDAQHGAEVYRATGHLPSIMYTAARLRWFAEQSPEVCGRIATVLPIAAWLACRLTGEAVWEPCAASESGLLDVTSRQPCTGLLSRLGISPSLLPSVMKAAGTPVGGLTQRLASEMGLRPNTPVAIAGPDTQCALLAMGVLQDGMVGVIAGWSCTVQMVTPRPCFDSEMRTWVGILPTPGGWIAESNVGDAGNAHRWLVETLIKDPNGYQQADELARSAPPGCDGVMAFLGPAPVSMARAGLRTGGFLFPTPLSFQETTPAHLLRAGLENVAFGVRANLEMLEGVTGLEAHELRLGGGMSRSAILADLLASVANRAVLQSTRPEVSTSGALLAAAVAAGERASLEEAARSVHFPHTEVAPSPSLAAEYEEHYRRWRSAYRKVQEVE